MEKKLSKSEELAKLAAIVSKHSPLGTLEWDFIFDMVLEYPEDARLILEDRHTRFYDQYFRKYFEVYDKKPELFRKYRNIPQLIIEQTPYNIEVLEVNQYKNPTNNHPVLKLKLGVFDESSYYCEVELSSYISEMGLRSLSPLTGIVASSPHIPYFANPSLNGYMRSNFRLRQKGFTQLIKMIDEIFNVVKMIRKYPAFVIGLYTLVYDKVKRVDEDAEYGKLETFAENFDIMKWANRITHDKFGISSSYPGDLVKSIQNILISHPEMFENRYN